MCNKISAFWDWLDIDIVFNPLVIFSYKFWLNLWDSFCFTLIYTSIIICACLICADIYVKQQADEESLTPPKTLQS